jgi:hypothetical protein
MRFKPISQMLFVLALGLAIGPALAAQDWVAKSDEYTAVRLTMDAEFSPEMAAQTGLDGYDDRISDFTSGFAAAGSIGRSR